MNRLCPCLSQKHYSECCEPYVHEACLAETPEKLMRSRYSAYTLGNIDYLVSSHHPSKRSKNDKTLLLKSMQATQWLGLIVHDAPVVLDSSGKVEFSAYYTESKNSTNLGPDNNLIQQIHERSTFIKEADRWFYFSGEFLPDHRLSRNDICFCGSLKKYKRCHANK